jgi:hypothetical protein
MPDGLHINSVNLDELAADIAGSDEGQHWYNTTEKALKLNHNAVTKVITVLDPAVIDRDAPVVSDASQGVEAASGWAYSTPANVFYPKVGGYDIGLAANRVGRTFGAEFRVYIDGASDAQLISNAWRRADGSGQHLLANLADNPQLLMGAPAMSGNANIDANNGSILYLNALQDGDVVVGAGDLYSEDAAVECGTTTYPWGAVYTNALYIQDTAPALVFTDTTVGDDDYSITVDGDNMTVVNVDSNANGEIILDHIINLRPNPRMPVPAFSGEEALRHTATTIANTGAVQGYFILKDSAQVQLGGAFCSYGVVAEIATVTGVDASTTNAAYVFVCDMTLTAALGDRPPAVHSFDSKPHYTAAAAVLNVGEMVGFNDWAYVQTTSTGQITVDRWVTVSARQFDSFYYKITSSGIGSSVIITDRIGFYMGEVLKTAGGGTEQITNQYALYVEAVSNVTTINCGIWIEALTGATSNYGIVLDSDGFGGGIWFGGGQDAVIYYSSSDLIIDPDQAGAGRVIIGVGGNNDMLLNNIEIDGDLDHDGTGVGFYGTAPIAKPTAAGAGGHAAVGGANVNANDTFTGGVGATAYTIGDLVAILKNFGLITA